MLFIGHIFCFSKNVLKEYNKMEEEIKNPETFVEYIT